MKADVSRDTFVAAKHYRSVRKQQGRVDVDADWNEQADLVDHLLTATTADVVGPSGGPVGAAAFALATASAGSDLRLSRGTFYVEGLRLEVDADFSVWSQPQVPAGAPIVRLGSGDDVAGPTPPAGQYLLYVAAGTQLVTALEDPDLREVALGGPDTATRVQTVWQVKLLRLGAQTDAVHCASTSPQWTALTAAPTGVLEARAQPGEDTDGPCALPAGAGYRLLRNNNYRVEIVRDGGPGVAQYVWSRDNASTVAAWTGRDGNRLTLAVPGRDRLAGFEPGALVELTDDEHQLLGRPGYLTRVARVIGETIEVTAAPGTPELDLAAYQTHPKVRVWECGEVATVTRPASRDGWLDVEGGVQVRWSGGASTYRAGTYWNVPARTLLDDVLWPRDGGTALAQPPRGADTRFARLGLARFDGATWSGLRDCRSLYAPLTAQTQLAYVSGDGQDALPDVADPTAKVPLAKPLVVGVTTGSVPVVGARVEFSVSTGSGTVAGGSSAFAVTGGDGQASALWSLDSVTPTQQLTARLLADGGGAVGLPVIFTAELSTAGRVAYAPGACAPLAAATTVQEALDTLCATSAAGCATLTVAPGDGLAEVLAALPAGGDAHVCLRPGDFTVTQTVVLQGLGHLKITGAGEASRIVGRGLEVALLVRGCRSVQVSDLSVVTTAVDVNPRASTPGVPWGDGIGGSVTVLDTPRVRIERVTAECGAGTSYGAACLTVRRDRGDEPLESVRVEGCDLRVGHLQAGLLLADVGWARVRGCRVLAVDAPALRHPERLATDERTRAALARLLVAEAVVQPIALAPQPDRNTVFRVGNYVVRLQSQVPVPQWRALLVADPPAATEGMSVAGVRDYVDRVTAATLEQPERLPTFREQLGRLRRSESGRGYLDTTAGKRFLREIIVAGDLDVVAVDDLAAQRRQVSLAVGEHRVRFDSPLPVEEWQAMLREVPATRLRHSGDLLRHLRRVAKRVVRDRDFRDRFPAAVQWFADLATDNPAAATYGVVCGGTVVGDLTVSGIEMTGMLEAVHVGVSGPRGPVSADTVRVADVAATVVRPATASNFHRAVFVGSARHLVISDTALVHLAPPAIGSPSGGVRTGVFVQGVLGPMLAIRANRLEGFRSIGFLVDPMAGSAALAQWVVADNVAVGSDEVVAAPARVRRVDNVG